MIFPEDYTADKKIESIGERLTAKVAINAMYSDPAIKLEGLQLNLSFLLAQIIKRLVFIERGREEFEAVIKQYNLDYGLEIAYKDFVERNWILEIGDEVLIPELLRHYVWKLGYEEQKGNIIEIPQDEEHFTKILYIYYKTYFETAKLTISKKEVVQILKRTSGSVTVDMLVEKKILDPANKNTFVWANQSHYMHHFNDEIAAILWADFGGEDADISKFNEFFKRLLAAGVWPNDMITYVPVLSSKRLSELAALFIEEQEDLRQSSFEFNKIWLSSKDQYNQGIDFIPVFDFDYSDKYNFIESIRFAQNLYPSRFDYPYTRKYCLLLLRFLVSSKLLGPKKFDVILKVVGSVDSPYILWNIYQESKRLFPDLIPYLLKNTDLAPLAFQMLDKLEIQGSYYSDASETYRYMREEINALWIDMFDIFLDLAARRPIEVKPAGVALARILKDLAAKVFKTSGSTTHAITDHTIYRQRYEDILKKVRAHISLLSFDNNGVTNSISIVRYLPEITEYIGAKLNMPKSYHRHHISLDIAEIDLGIELLNLLRFGIYESYKSGLNTDILTIREDDLTNCLFDNLLKYYTVIEINVLSFDRRDQISQKVSRSTTEFGFEIIDWGQLFLSFEQKKLLDVMDSNVITALEFNYDEDKYYEQNLEQAIKLSYYVKSLLLAFQQLNSKKAEYEVKGLPVSPVIEKIGNWIRKYALKYSVNDTANSRIDIFNERYNAFGYNKYYQHLANLLYSCIPYFEVNVQEQFVRDYFSHNTDISRLLAAINVFSSKELQDIVSKRVSELDIEQYIESKFMVTDLEYALVEAVNSEHHFHLAESFLGRITEHYNKKKTKTEQSEDFIFEISLLLAFKNKNYERLNDLEVPQRQYHIRGTNEMGKRLKSFYITLYKIYIDKEYDSAIESLRLLLQEEPKNVRYAFHLYRAQTLKAMEI